MRIRAERECDRAGVHDVTVEAFGQATEAELVDALRGHRDAVISLVAVEGDAIVGHVLFSRLNAPPECLALAPVSVRPDCQRRGIGSKLIREGLVRARRAGWSCVFVLGEPDYYSRFGFSLEAATNFETPYPKQYFMALDLGNGSTVRGGGPVVYPPAFGGFGEGGVSMAGELEQAVAQHYGVPDLQGRIERALQASGADLGYLTVNDLAPVDEFHIGGRTASEYVLAKMKFDPSQHVLDVGCGLGGPARYLAKTFGCRVTGLDLTPEYVETATNLTGRVGLGDRVAFRAGSALAMPFADQTFDAAITFHVAMNIKDRATLYREVARVLKPGAAFCVYDVMKGRNEGLNYPVPWADSPATSHLTTPEEMRTLLHEAGFSVVLVEDRTAFGIDFFRQRLAAGASPMPLGLHILMGPSTPQRFQNMLKGLEAGAIAPVIMIAERA